MRAIVASTVVAVAVLLVGACEKEPPLKLGLTPPQHTSFFPIVGNVPHAIGATAQNGEPISCDSCHAGADDFSTPICQQCHAQDATPLARAHAGVPDFAAVDASCYACHADGQRGPELDVASHSATLFPIGAATVHGDDVYRQRAGLDATAETCASCHKSDVDRTINSCAECHAADPTPIADAHAALPRSFGATSDACKSCHADVPIDPSVHPLTNHTFYDPNHHDALCVNCHEAKRGDPQPWAIDFGVGTCTGCHTHGSDCTPTNQAVCVR